MADNECPVWKEGWQCVNTRKAKNVIEDAGTGIPVQEGERRMRRLIDADKLKEQIHCAYSDDLEILEKIDAQPTAYDTRTRL